MSREWLYVLLLRSQEDETAWMQSAQQTVESRGTRRVGGLVEKTGRKRAWGGRWVFRRGVTREKWTRRPDCRTKEGTREEYCHYYYYYYYYYLFFFLKLLLLELLRRKRLQSQLPTRRQESNSPRRNDSESRENDRPCDSPSPNSPSPQCSEPEGLISEHEDSAIDSFHLDRLAAWVGNKGGKSRSLASVLQRQGGGQEVSRLFRLGFILRLPRPW
jgi:hypothetical protein